MPIHRLWGKRIKILVRKNLKMTPNKIAAQSVHATLALASVMQASPAELMAMANMTTVTLDASNQKFWRAKKELEENGILCYAFEDAGYTEVEKNTVTVMAFLEDDPKAERDENRQEEATQA
jgi:peptidyl-tRNA hydrolase